MKQKIKTLLRKFFLSILPPRKIILFESYPDFSDNTYWFFKYIAETGNFPDYRFVWFLMDYEKRKKELCGVPITCVDQYSRSLLGRIRVRYYLYSAKIIIDCNRRVPKIRSEQIRIYLGHGMGIKKVLNYLRSIGNCDGFTIMGEGFRPQYEPYVDGKLIPFGFPRNEILTQRPVNQDEPYIVWLPTYRQHSRTLTNRIENEFPLGIPAIKTQAELDKLQACLKERGIKLFIRLHPAQDTSVLKIAPGGNILLADDAYLESIGETLYPFLAASSALITDYSSVYYDYLLTERPIGLTIEDAEAYAAKWGLWYDDIRHQLPGFLIDTCEDMVRFVESIADGKDDFLEQRQTLAQRYGIVPRESSRLIVEYIQDALKRKS